MKFWHHVCLYVHVVTFLYILHYVGGSKNRQRDVDHSAEVIAIMGVLNKRSLNLVA